MRLKVRNERDDNGMDFIYEWTVTHWFVFKRINRIVPITNYVQRHEVQSPPTDIRVSQYCHSHLSILRFE